jgi:acyl dehydratase
MGLTVAELCAACDFDVAEGPMMATSGARFLQPLRTGQAYVVRGSVISLTRKASRKLGVMDLLEYRLSLILPNGETVLEVDNVWVLPRGAKP